MAADPQGKREPVSGCVSGIGDDSGGTGDEVGGTAVAIRIGAGSGVSVEAGAVGVAVNHRNVYPPSAG